MRKAQYALPKVSGDGEDGELAVFYFGQGQGGSVEANIERWIGQISQPDGSSSKDKAKTNKKEIGGMRSVLLSGNGTLLINNTFVEWATVQAVRRAKLRSQCFALGCATRSSRSAVF